MTGDKIRSGAPRMMLYQKELIGVFVGAVFQRLTCRLIHDWPLLAKRGQLGLYYYII